MQQALRVKIKRLHPNAVIPKYAKAGDAGMDLVVTEVKSDEDDKVTYRTGLAFEIPIGFAGFLFSRSSIRNKDLSLSNSVGVVDSGYRGEVEATFYKTRFSSEIYEAGEKALQIIIMPYPQIEFEEVEELSTTERGTGGFGSTGV